MSENNQVQVEFGGGVDSSYDSSVDHVKKGLRETADEHGKLTREVVSSVATVGAAYATHQAKIGAMRAAFAVVRTVASDSLAAIISTAVRVAPGLGIATAGVVVLRGAMSLLRAASDEAAVGLDKLAAKEDLVSKLEPLVGSLDAAKAKLKELAALRRGTPLALPDVVDAFRATKVQTGGALSDQKGLTMMGDVATASGNGIKETSEAVSQLYGDLQAGAPIADATQKLQDMGIVSAEVTQHIYALQYEGKTGAEVWAYLAGQLDKSSGAMKAAADNLSTLQQSLADAKDRLHELFAEALAGGQSGSDDGAAKSAIKDQIAAMEALQPAAKEAGSVYASLRSIVPDALQYIAEKLGITKKATDESHDSILRHVGSLQSWVDVLTVTGVALTTLAAAAVGYGSAVTVGGVATALGATALAGVAAVAGTAALVFGALAAVVLSGGIAYRIYADHAIEADKALVRTIESNRQMLASLRTQEQGIKSVTDKILALAKAYDVLTAAQEQRRHATTPEQRTVADNAVTSARLAIRRIEERHPDDKLKPGEARAKSEKETKDAKEATEDLLNDPKQKFDDALEDMKEARKKQYELREKLAAAQRAAAPGGEATDAVVEPQIEAIRKRIAASRRTEKDYRSQAVLLDDINGKGGGAPLLALADKEKAKQDEDRQKARDLDGLRRGRLQRVENARTELAAQDTVVAKSGTELVKAERSNNDYQNRQQQLEIQKQIAELQSEGVLHAREEYALKKQGLEQELQLAEQSPDKTKAADVKARMAQLDAEQRKQEQALALHMAELTAEQQIAGLKTEGFQRTKDEWAIRRAGLEEQLKTAKGKGDEGKVAEITTKIAQGDASVSKEGRKNADAEREVEAEAKIASLQSEGIARARAENEIRLRLIEARWQEAEAAKDALAADKARADWIKQHQGMAEKERQNSLAEGKDMRELNDQISRRQDDAAKRELDRRYKTGQITDKQHREGEAALVERERQRLEAEAKAKEKEAREALAAGDKDKAIQLTTEAQRLHSQADAKKDEGYDLLHPPPQRTAVADSLQRVGGGGNVYYGGGKNPLEAKIDRQVKATEEAVTVLKKIEERRAGSAFQ